MNVLLEVPGVITDYFFFLEPVSVIFLPGLVRADICTRGCLGIVMPTIRAVSGCHNQFSSPGPKNASPGENRAWNNQTAVMKRPGTFFIYGGIVSF